MAQPNLIRVVVDDTVLTEVRNAIGVLRKTLVPLLLTLSAQDRKELLKLGDKSTAFVRKAYEYMAVHPDLVPPYVDRGELKIDLDALDLLQGLERELLPVMEALSDSAMLSGSEAFQAALLFYRSLRSSTMLNIGSSAQVYADLSNRFPYAPTKRPAAAKS